MVHTARIPSNIDKCTTLQEIEAWVRKHGHKPYGVSNALLRAYSLGVGKYNSDITPLVWKCDDLIAAITALLDIIEPEYEADPERDDLESWKRAIDEAQEALARAEGRA